MGGEELMKNSIFKYIFLFFKGILVGFGAIMPGISGGTLCVSFGMYTPLLNVMSHPVKAIRTDGLKLLFFILGAGVGFIGLSGLAGWLMSVNSTVVILVFIGFIIGTIPELWKDAGERGRNKFSYLYMAGGFAVLFALLYFLKNSDAVNIGTGFGAFFFCGIMWALSFIVPGLSSSTLLVFFGIYEPMLVGISKFTPSVILPLAVGAIVCLILVSRAVNVIFEKWHSQVSHIIIGVVIASMIMVIPFDGLTSPSSIAVGALSVVGGAAVSYLAGRLTNNLK